MIPPTLAGPAISFASSAIKDVANKIQEQQSTASSEQLAGEFESVFASLLIQQMRKAGGGDGLFPGDKSDTMGGIFDMFLGKQMSAGQGLGLREIIEGWLDQQN